MSPVCYADDSGSRRSLIALLDKWHFRFCFASLLLVHLLNLFFDNANRLVQPVLVLTHPFDLDGSEPLSSVLRRLAQRLEMSGPHQERQVIIRPAENSRRLFHAHARRPTTMKLFVRNHIKSAAAFAHHNAAPGPDAPGGRRRHRP